MGARIRAGILESSSVEALTAAGLGKRLHREGYEHRGIYLQWPEERHHLDFVDLVGRSVWVYGQTEITKDLVEARDAAGQELVSEISDTRLHDLDTDRPAVTFVDADAHLQRLGTAGCSWPATPRISCPPPAPKGSTSRSPTSRCWRPQSPA